MKPLSQHAVAELQELEANGAEPRNGMNPGVVDLLCRRGLVAVVVKPSPYPTHKGMHIEHLAITELGRAELRIVELVEALNAFLRAPSVGSNGPGSSTIVVQEFNLREARRLSALYTPATKETTR
jgi:hypothetical protein